MDNTALYSKSKGPKKLIGDKPYARLLCKKGFKPCRVFKIQHVSARDICLMKDPRRVRNVNSIHRSDKNSGCLAAKSQSIAKTKPSCDLPSGSNGGLLMEQKVEKSSSSLPFEHQNIETASITKIVKNDSIEKEQICNICSASFMHEHLLERHLQSHTLDKSWHLLENDLVEKETILESKRGRKLKKTLNDEKKPHVCSFCKQEFNQPSKLWQHVEVHTGEKKPYLCSICNTGYKTKYLLEKHTEKHLNEQNLSEAVEKLIEKDYVSNETNVSCEMDHLCDICSKSFKTLAHLKSHMKNHSEEKPYKCDLCNQVFRWPNNLKDHQETHRKKSYPCTQCRMSFVTIKSLLLHFTTHTGKKAEWCKICKQLFEDSELYSEHKKSHHPSEKPYKCDICDCTFVKVSILNKHMQIHTGEKEHLCSTCGKNFRQHNDLLRHMLTHEGTKQFQCPLCPMTFLQAQTLKNHVITHTDEKPYKCNECTKSFARNSQLQQHSIVHTGERNHKCDMCEKAFFGLHALKRHKMLHSSEELPFKCTLCAKTFIQSQGLKRHMLSHTKEKPYQCLLCDKSYANPENLKQHTIKHKEEAHECAFCHEIFPSLNELLQHTEIHATSVWEIPPSPGIPQLAGPLPEEKNFFSSL